LPVQAAIRKDKTTKVMVLNSFIAILLKILNLQSSHIFDSRLPDSEYL